MQVIFQVCVPSPRGTSNDVLMFLVEEAFDWLYRLLMYNEQLNADSLLSVTLKLRLIKLVDMLELLAGFRRVICRAEGLLIV